MTLICVFFAYVVINNNIKLPKTNIKYSQSHIDRLISPFLPENSEIKKFASYQSQARNHRKSTLVNVIIVDDTAYWIKDNKFFYADVIDGEFDTQSAKEVDTMNMDKVQLDKMMFIVERLAERNES